MMVSTYGTFAKRLVNKQNIKPSIKFVAFKVCPEVQSGGTLIPWKMTFSALNEKSQSNQKTSEVMYIRQKNSILNVKGSLMKLNLYN